jgi:hypothetical protein
MLARVVYDLLQQGVAFDLNAFLRREGRGVGEPAASREHEGRAWPPGAAHISPGGPAPAPEPHWRLQLGSPWFEWGAV